MADDDKRPVIDEDECTGCGLCVDECEQGCLELNDDDMCVLARPDDCTSCGNCEEECPSEAIALQ